MWELHEKSLNLVIFIGVNHTKILNKITINQLKMISKIQKGGLNSLKISHILRKLAQVYTN